MGRKQSSYRLITNWDSARRVLSDLLAPRPALNDCCRLHFGAGASNAAAAAAGQRSYVTRLPMPDAYSSPPPPPPPPPLAVKQQHAQH